MRESIKELVLAIASGDAVQSEELFNSIMDAKAEEQVNDWQINIAQTMFAEPVAEDAEFASLEDVLTEEQVEALDEDAYADYLAKGGKITKGKEKKNTKFDAMNKEVTKRMGAKVEGEEVEGEQIDELKGSTLGNYIDKASDDTNTAHAHGRGWTKEKGKDRSKGLSTAIDKLTRRSQGG